MLVSVCVCVRGVCRTQGSMHACPAMGAMAQKVQKFGQWTKFEVVCMHAQYALCLTGFEVRTVASMAKGMGIRSHVDCLLRYSIMSLCLCLGCLSAHNNHECNPNQWKDNFITILDCAQTQAFKFSGASNAKPCTSSRLEHC